MKKHKHISFLILIIGLSGTVTKTAHAMYADTLYESDDEDTAMLYTPTLPPSKANNMTNGAAQLQAYFREHRIRLALQQLAKAESPKKERTKSAREQFKQHTTLAEGERVLSTAYKKYLESQALAETPDDPQLLAQLAHQEGKPAWETDTEGSESSAD